MLKTGRFGRWPPAARMAGTPRHAGISGKKKGPETIRALQFGGGGGNRTRVRQSSTLRSTCLVWSIDLTEDDPTDRVVFDGPGVF